MATITKRKAKTGDHFRVRVRLDGVNTSRTFDTHDEAKRWGARMETGIDLGDYVGQDDSHRMTLHEALDRYKDEVTSQKRGRRQEERRICSFQQNNPLLCSRKLASLRGQDFAEWKKERLAAGKATNTIRIELCLFNRVFKQAKYEWGMESLRNPLDNVSKPKGSRSRDRRFTPEELTAISENLSEQMRNIVIFALGSAMRRGEICRAQWSDVDFGAGEIRNVLGRNGKYRNVLLTPTAIALLRKLPRPLDGGPIFAFHPDTLTWQFAAACKQVNVTGACFHTLRHEATSRLVEAGLDMKEVMSITGHSALTMLLRYYHPNRNTIRAKFEAAGL